MAQHGAAHLVAIGGRAAVGFAGLWGTCAAVYAVSPVCFALAQPSPQAHRLLLN